MPVEERLFELARRTFDTPAFPGIECIEVQATGWPVLGPGLLARPQLVGRGVITVVELAKALGESGEAAMRRRYVQAIRSFYGWASESGALEVNPAEHLLA